MRVLIAHSRIGTAAPSGENVVVDVEQRLLQSRGHEVFVFERANDILLKEGVRGAVAAAVSAPWNPCAVSQLRNEIRRFRPDVVHVHNTFPRLSPAIFRAPPPGVARVHTLHNYSIYCAGGLPLRQGRPCTLCLEQHSVLPALRYGCYRQSWLATIPRAATVALHRSLRTWQQHVEAFIALTHFQKDLLVAAGLPVEKMHVRPNVFLGSPAIVEAHQRGGYALFAGRLSEEKGVRLLVEAWLELGACAPPLRIAGDGPQRQQLQERAPASVSFLGTLSEKEVCEQIANATLVVVPSVVYEGFPLVVRESFAFGTPVLVASVGPLPEIVRHGQAGALFEGGNSSSLAAAVTRIWDDAGGRKALADAGRAVYNAEIAEEQGYRSLIDIYLAAIERAADTGRGRR